jgi:hypothetical protein
MNCWETLFMQMYNKHNILIAEQQVIDTNPLIEITSASRDLQCNP